jgi:hypothetical protein
MLTSLARSNLGVHFSLDDFGTGYSSLTYFHRLPISILKIDRSFVMDMLSDSRDQDIVEGVLSLAEALKRPVVAEGVENIELGAMLLQLGCQYAQGYGIARPMPAEALLNWSRQWNDEVLWKDLPGRIPRPTRFYDVNAAYFTHQLWMERLVDHLKSGVNAEPPMDETACQFSQWYQGIGASRYSESEQFAFIGAKHQVIHELGIELLALANNQNKETALNRLDEVKTLSDELITLLAKLVAN